MLGYVIKQGVDGEWYASIVSLGNHQQIWRTGDGYADKSDALHAVELLRKAGADLIDITGSDPVLAREQYDAEGLDEVSG